jgi:hypothetical protein
VETNYGIVPGVKIIIGKNIQVNTSEEIGYQ